MAVRQDLSIRAARSGILPERVVLLNDAPVRPDRRFVVYWMQASQRERMNHALEYAVLVASDLNVPLVVWFGLTDDYPGATLRHYAFLLEGLSDVARALEQRGIRFVAHHTDPAEGLTQFAEQACQVVTDRGYTRIQREWREHAAVECPCRLVQVESDVVVPVEWASDKAEYAARTLRPKIHKQLERFLVPLRRARVKHDSLGLALDSLDITDTTSILAQLDIDRSVPPSPVFTGGEAGAARRLRAFLNNHLDGYDEDGNDPSLAATSRLSPYLHFGQISPLDIALAVRKRGGHGAEPFLEQLIVRRELAINFTQYTPKYDAYACLPDWARRTLRKHARDKREYRYSPAELENAATHDPYWNAAQTEMLTTGHMHNYMRMYWGKKVLEWTERPEDAFALLLTLNNQYELDGRDPNGFTGVAWTFGLHDRPWQERPVFGTVRYMNANGLNRKFDMARYVERVSGNSHRGRQ